MSKLTISRDTTLCMSLAGRPGNFGTRFQNHLYDELRLDYLYKSFTTRDLKAAIGGVRALGVRGCAISMPFKEAVIPLVDELDPSAEAIGSVNTIVNDDGHLKAYNTDYIAIAKLIDHHKIEPGTRFLLRGSGGMAKAVAAAFRDKGFANGIILARNEERGRALAKECGFGWRSDEDATAELLINVTPVGMEGGVEATDLAFPPEAIRAATTIFDVVALPPETPLIKEALAQKKKVITGAEVMILQGLEQFVLYTGVHPTEDQVARAADFALS